MVWQTKKRRRGRNQHYSIIRKLRDERRSNEEFEIMLNNLSLEEIIGLKLELASKTFNGKMYGIPLWNAIPSITKDAVFKYALSATRTQVEAARFLGVNITYFKNLKKKYGVITYFEGASDNKQEK
jgi:hypothetical protein